MKTTVEIKFGGHLVPGGDAESILGPSQCGPDVVKLKEYTWEAFGGVERPGVDVEITLDDKDPRVQKVLDLLAAHGNEPWVYRRDVYTEDELQAAPLLILDPWQCDLALGVATYDDSNACPKCRTGRRQTSPLDISRRDLKQMEKLRVAFTMKNNVLVQDVDVERLLAAGVTGALFWPVYANKVGEVEELRRQQLFIEHVMPPMSPTSLLDRRKVCPDCQRGWFLHVSMHPLRCVYRREDLANIQDFNLTWESFGEPPSLSEGGLGGGPQYTRVLVTPKVMNLLRGKTKKEAKYQGCRFIPIWIEDEKHALPYVQT
jgi:hypothetical protein